MTRFFRETKKLKTSSALVVKCQYSYAEALFWFTEITRLLIDNNKDYITSRYCDTVF